MLTKLYLLENLPFFKIHVDHFVARDNSRGAKVISKAVKFLQKHQIYHFLHFFYIDGTKNAKASFCSLKKYKVFYTKFHSAQQNKLYALIQVICLYPYPINIVSDSIYSVFVLKNIETSTINS